MRISTVIITFNEAENIAKCIDSVLSFSDEIIIVDSFSTDATRSICLSYPKVKFHERAFDGYISQKNYANSIATSEYIFSIDADEWCSEPLISFLNTSSSMPDLMQVGRKNYYCNTLIKYGSWVPDAKIRFWKRGVAIWGGKMPHEELIYEKNVPVFKSSYFIFHNAYTSISSHLMKSIKYATMAAEYQLSYKKSFYLLIKLISSPIVRFIKGYFIKKGFLGGVFGLLIELIISFETFYKYVLALKYKIIKK